MKSGDKFSKHVQRASFMTECFNVEYERLKAVLTTCHHCKRSELDDCCEPGEPPTFIMSSFGPCSGNFSNNIILSLFLNFCKLGKL